MSLKINKFSILIIFLVCSCSSIQKVSKDFDSLSLIQKPDFNYNINSLPKNIIIYSSKEFETEDFPEEFRGLLANSYFFNSNISYKPKITFKNFSFKNCEIQSNKDELVILFDLKIRKGEVDQNCLNQLNKQKVFYVAKNNFQGFTNSFLVSPDSERGRLIAAIPSNSKKFGIITSKDSIDDESINKLIAAEKSILIIKSFDEKKSSQDLFSEILLTQRSEDRKRKLSRRLSKNIIGDSRSREDLDSFYFSVDLREARNLKPALDYISEDKFDIFLLNSWEKEESYFIKDKDLIGSINSDMPVMMPIRLPNYLPSSGKNRDFAIGYDTFQIILLKYGLNNLKGITYKGLTGEISFSGRKILRKSYVFKITEEGYEIL